MPAVSTAGQRLAHRAAADDPVRRDFGERHKHEGALEQARMRQRQAQFVELRSS